jgi:hypothetical protein
LDFVEIAFLAIANPNVNVPTRPVYMVKINIIFPVSESPDVIPVDNPTVPNAETSSKRSLIKSVSLSVMVRKKN